MTEKELLELGFTKEFSTNIIEDEPDFYYYFKEILLDTLPFTNGLTFITNGNYEMEGKEWYVEFFNTENEREYQLRYFDDQIETSIEIYELQGEFQYVRREPKTIAW